MAAPSGGGNKGRGEGVEGGGHDPPCSIAASTNNMESCETHQEHQLVAGRTPVTQRGGAKGLGSGGRGGGGGAQNYSNSWGQTRWRGGGGVRGGTWG